MIRTLALIIALVPGCARTVRGPYVAKIELRGNQLLLEKCTIEFVDDEMATGACHTESRTLPAPPITPTVIHGPPGGGS